MPLVLPLLLSMPPTEFAPPVRLTAPSSVPSLPLTGIGSFGLLRKARPNIPAHYHTGIDIRRPAGDDGTAPVYSIARGTVISKRDDGPYAQIIIRHRIGATEFWTVYEHIAGITVNLFDSVDTHRPIARFMNDNELRRYGRQFDHLHFEILKRAPKPAAYRPAQPQLQYTSYSLVCFTQDDLSLYFYDPLKFLGALRRQE